MKTLFKRLFGSRKPKVNYLNADTAASQMSKTRKVAKEPGEAMQPIFLLSK